MEIKDIKPNCRISGSYIGADTHPSNEVINNICKWLEENLDLYVGRKLEDYDMQYYGIIDKESLLDDFLREFSK